MGIFIGDIAEQYLRKFASVSDADKTFGLLDKDGKFYIGNKEVKIKENKIVGDREYGGTQSIWGENDQYTGNGITPSVTTILPSDPIGHVDRLNILLASKAAGNTGVWNELVSTCDELLR